MKSVGYDLEQLKPSYIIGKKVKLYSHHEKKQLFGYSFQS